MRIRADMQYTEGIINYIRSSVVHWILCISKGHKADKMIIKCQNDALHDIDANMRSLQCDTDTSRHTVRHQSDARHTIRFVNCMGSCVIVYSTNKTRMFILYTVYALFVALYTKNQMTVCVRLSV
eukprot:920378_1